MCNLAAMTCFLIGAAAQALILDPLQDFAENPPKFYEHPVTLSDSYRIDADINGDGLRDLLLTHAGMWDMKAGPYWTTYLNLGDGYQRLNGPEADEGDAVIWADPHVAVIVPGANGEDCIRTFKPAGMGAGTFATFRFDASNEAAIEYLDVHFRDEVELARLMEQHLPGKVCAVQIDLSEMGVRAAEVQAGAEETESHVAAESSSLADQYEQDQGDESASTILPPRSEISVEKEIVQPELAEGNRGRRTPLAWAVAGAFAGLLILLVIFLIRTKSSSR